MLEEVRQTIKKLANSKAPGSDAITAELIKGGGQILFGALHKLFLKVWEERKFPDEWNLGIICTFHKKCDIF
jgi:hypothetical protein